ncbi:Protein of unknown function [Bacillus cereus]|nr:Protein of unknown function [Bacillus cereus]
MWYKKGSTE